MELYLFNDNGVLHAFTPTILSKSLSGITYQPTIITRNNITITDNFAKSPVTLSFERSHSYAKELLANLPEKPISVTIYRNSLTYWRGRVTEVKLSKSSSIDITCDSIYSSQRNSGRLLRISPQCRHILYSPDCGVLENDWKVSYTVTASSSSISILAITQPSGYFTAGKARMGGQERFILDHTGTNILLIQPFQGVLTGIIDLFPGCALTESACLGFNNLPNHLGFSRLPGKNPFSATGLL